MTNETSYYDAEPGEPMARPSYRPPWWDAETQPCAHQDGTNPVPDQKPFLLNIHTGFSDSTFRQWKCLVCGHTWCDYLEG